MWVRKEATAALCPTRTSCERMRCETLCSRGHWPRRSCGGEGDGRYEVRPADKMVPPPPPALVQFLSIYIAMFYARCMLVTLRLNVHTLVKGPGVGGSCFRGELAVEPAVPRRG